jgi:hypothetical protein
MTQRYWRIRGYDGTTEIFHTRVEVGQITYEQLKQLLKALAAKAGLDNHEMVGTYAKRRTTIANGLLTIRREPVSATLSCGTNPHFVASVVDEGGTIVSYPRHS